jgi:2-enoate reductase
MNTLIEDIKALDADEVIIATGSKARRIPIKGVERSVEAIDYLLDNSLVGDKVVVIGGGLTGCEIAYDLYLKGKTPIIVETQDDLITTKGVCLANTSYLRDFFKTNKVAVHLESSVAEICEGKVLVKDKEGNIIEVDADSVIMSVGYTPAPLAEKARHVHVIGAANKVGNLRTVIWGAWQVCMKL